MRTSVKDNQLKRREALTMPLGLLAIVACTLSPLTAHATGTGADGAITISASKNINMDHLAAGRTAADGEAFAVSAIGSNTVGLTGTGTGGTAATSASTSLAAGDDVLLINLRGDATNNGNVGMYEIATVQSVSGATVTLVNPLKNT